MYFDFDDYRPDTPRVTTAISWREGVLLSIIFHLLMVITLILSPKLFTMSDAAPRRRHRTRQTARTDGPRRRADRSAMRFEIFNAMYRPMTTGRAAADSTARRFSSIPRVSNLVPGSVASSLRSSGTGSCRIL